MKDKNKKAKVVKTAIDIIIGVLLGIFLSGIITALVM